jgi:hypothetical protein
MSLAESITLIRKRWPAVRSSAQDEPVFLLAAGWRSGSTMLQRMLLHHCLVWGEPYGSSGLIERLCQPLQRFAPNWPKDEYFVDSPHWDGRLGEQWTANLYPNAQQLLDAHVAFFQTLLAEPSRGRGYARWGMKEVRYGIDHAVYLQWLFPKARFLFLIRNPYACWASYRRARSTVLRFWPEELILTPEQFGRHWVDLAAGFTDRWRDVAGKLLRYESLTDAAYDGAAFQDYLGFKLDAVAQKVMVGASPPGPLNPDELDRLEQIVKPLASSLGYENTFLPNCKKAKQSKQND